MKLLILFFLLMSCTHTKYPAQWWEPVSEKDAPGWEILPQAAIPHEEVILSKRNELGILSNFAATPFYYKSKPYASVEGFWQMMKFPDPELKNDPRAKIKFPHSRAEVSQMSGFEAKAAGDAAEKIMLEQKIDWVTFEGEKMTYCSPKKEQHFFLIREVMIKKLRYNPEVRRVLLGTGDLKLKPDHQEEACKAPEWKYYEMWEQLRKEVKRGQHLAPIMLP